MSMDEKERLNIIRVLNKTIKAIASQDIKLLKNLSNETIHDATIYQKEYSITLAVIIYTLSKLYERETSYEKEKGWNTFCLDSTNKLDTAKSELEKNDIIGFDKAIKEYLNTLTKLNIKLKESVMDVIHRAKINKASRLCEHGLSIGRTADLLGVSKFEIMDYIGKTGISNVKENQTVDPIKRLKIARGLFK